MNITAAMVKELRETTGAGMMDCKKALTHTEGDMAKAVDYLREKGLAAAAKKESRIAAEGVVGTYICEKCGVEDMTKEELAEELLNYVLAVASGRKTICSPPRTPARLPD